MHSIIFVFLIIFLIRQGKGTIYKCDTNALCGCSSSSTILTRIIGGENALDRSWSWSISLRNDGSHICGGSILSSTFIITAAHCIPYLTRLSTITILAGSLTLNSSLSNKNSQIRSTSQIYEHPNYNLMTSENDLALLRLSIPLNLTNGYIKPIYLPNGTLSQPANDIDMIAVGWGVTTLTEYTPALDLRQVTLKSLRSTSNDCQKVIVNSQLQFCAGIPAGGKDTCQGDSGGPLMAFINGLWQLHGITSYGYECALPGYPGVYTRVSSYISWINAVMQTSQLTTLVTNKSTTLTTKKPVVTTTTTTKKPITSSTITTTTTKKSPLTTTTVIKKTISQNSTRNSVKEIQYEETSDTTKQNHFPESSLKPSSGRTYSMNQSLFLLTIIFISSNYFLLLFIPDLNITNL